MPLGHLEIDRDLLAVWMEDRPALSIVRDIRASMMEEIGSQPSYLSGNALEAHFGVGRATDVERLTVRFPSGVVREMEHLPSDQTVVVSE